MIKVPEHNEDRDLIHKVMNMIIPIPRRTLTPPLVLRQQHEESRGKELVLYTPNPYTPEDASYPDDCDGDAMEIDSGDS